MPDLPSHSEHRRAAGPGNGNRTNVGYVVAIDAFDMGSGISFADIFGLVRKRLLLLIVAGLIGGVAGLLLSFMVDHRFEGTTTVVWAGTGGSSASFGDFGGQLGSIASVAGLLPNGDDARQEALAILRSRAFAESFILENNLMPVLFADEWDAAKNNWKEEHHDDPPSIRDAFKFFDTRIRSVEEDARAGVIRVRIVWTDPEVAAAWANGLIEKVNEQIRQQKIAEANASIGFLQSELESQKNIELRSAIFGMMESQLNAIMIAQVNPDYAFRVVDPAVIADDDDYSYPNRLLFVIAGGVLAGLLTFLFLLARRRGT